MAKSHKKQHAVPASYLGAWVDPDTPKGYEPYVHVFAKDGTPQGRSPPFKLFWQNDLYTVKESDGSRDLTVEHGLAQIEDDFIKVRRNFLANQRPLTATVVIPAPPGLPCRYKRSAIRLIAQPALAGNRLPNDRAQQFLEHWQAPP